MKSINIWFNQNHATHYLTVNSLREAARESGYNARLFTTSDQPLSPVLSAGDVVHIEPRRSTTAETVNASNILEGTDYVRWALSYVRRHQIDVFIPYREAWEISKHVSEFEAMGCKVIVDSTNTFETIENKETAYLFAEKIGVATPPWRTASTGTELKKAYADLKAEIPSDIALCIKPVDGIGAQGFKRIVENKPEASFGSLIASQGINDVYWGDMEPLLTDSELGGRYLVLPWLDNPEISVDTLAVKGEAKIIIPRAKNERNKGIGGQQTVEAADFSRKLVRALNMNGISNTQTRMWEGNPVYLETNVRMSGGIPATFLTGINMVWEAILLAVEGKEIDSFDASANENIPYTTVSDPVTVVV